MPFVVGLTLGLLRGGPQAAVTGNPSPCTRAKPVAARTQSFGSRTLRQKISYSAPISADTSSSAML